MEHNKNAFDLLRIVFALFVLISHSYLLGGRTDEPLYIFSKGQTNLGNIGVMGFFSLSGYLITASFSRSPNILRFLRNRLLRIFPGYWFCLIVTAFVIAPTIFYVNNKSFAGFNFWSTNGALTFVYKNALLSIQQWNIGNVLQNSAFNYSINSSLWSLLPEMCCYLFTLFFGLFGLLKANRQTFALLFIFAYIFYIANIYTENFGPTFLALSKARSLYIAYLCGMAIYIFRDKININLKGQAFIIFASLTLIKFGGFLVAAPLCIAIIGILGFSNFKVSVKLDISYGLYIYAVPIQLLCYAFWGNQISLLLYILTSVSLTAFFATLSAVFIERPFLRLKVK